MSDVVQTLWGFCHTLRHDGVDYGDYIEQLTYLLFLKMTSEREIDLTKIPWQDEKGKHTTDCSWRNLTSKSGTPLADHYAALDAQIKELTKARDAIKAQNLSLYGKSACQGLYGYFIVGTGVVNTTGTPYLRAMPMWWIRLGRPARSGR